MLAGIQQHPELLARLASDDTYECCSASRAGVVLLRLGILHGASTYQG
jgi:hypothetical protein